MKIEMKLTGIEKALKMFSPESVRKAAQKTILRAAKSGKTEISKQIREDFNIKKEDLDKKISVNLEGLDKPNPEAKLIVIGKPIDLMYFGPKQDVGKTQRYISKERGLAVRLKRRARGRGLGPVRVKIKKYGGTTSLRAFIAPGKGNRPHVFQRIGKSRYPLRIKRVITCASIIRKKENLAAVQRKIWEQMLKEWRSNIKHFGKEI